MHCVSLEETKSLAKDQLCHINEGWLPAYCGACDGGSRERKKRKKDKERERQRQDEVEGAIQRAEVAAMVTSITHTHTHTNSSTITNSFMFNRHSPIFGREVSAE